MKILITGGAGFIGSNFVHYWLKQHPDDQLRVLDKLTYAGNLQNLAGVLDKIEFIEGDITNPEVVDKAMQDINTVVHFAAETHVDRSIHNPFVFSNANVLGTHVLLEAARKHKINRFHHISTDEVYGDIPLDEDWKFNEATPYNPSSPYAASKAGSDYLVQSYGRTFDLPFTISNCSNNFGPFHYPEKFIPRSIIRLLAGQNIRLYTPGNQIRDWLYVEDHCRAIELILLQGKIGETYCVGGLANGISNQQVAEQILSILKLPTDRIEFIKDRAGHDVKYDIDWTKINQELGWQPLHDFEYWLTKTVEWYQTNQNWWQDLAKESEQFYETTNEQLII